MHVHSKSTTKPSSRYKITTRKMQGLICCDHEQRIINFHTLEENWIKICLKFCILTTINFCSRISMHLLPSYQIRFFNPHFKKMQRLEVRSNRKSKQRVGYAWITTWKYFNVGSYCKTFEIQVSFILEKDLLGKYIELL